MASFTKKNRFPVMLPSEGFIATARHGDSVIFTINTILMRHVDDRHGLDMFCTEATSTSIVTLHLYRTMYE